MAFKIFNWDAAMWLQQKSRAKSERNQQIFRDRQAGLSFTQLAKKHGLSHMTCFNICRREAEKYRSPPPVDNAHVADGCERFSGSARESHYED